MATLQQVNQHRDLVHDIVTVALSDLVKAWRSFTLDDAREAEAQLKGMLPQIVDGYGYSVADLSADWYDELRDDAKALGRYVAKPGDLPAAQQAQALAGWAASPLYQESPDSVLALSRAAGGLQRLIAGVDRQTQQLNVAADPATVTFVRQAQAGACAFCAMLSTRSAVYASKRAALTVVGRGTEKRFDGSTIDRLRKGIKARGVRQIGDSYHDHCRCEAVPYWSGQDLELGPHDIAYTDAYLAATDSVGHGDTKAILAEMRTTLGTH